jgi:hypothetical protein
MSVRSINGRRTCMVLAFGVLVMGLAALAGNRKDGQPANRGVVPPDATYLGKTYGQWHTAWWTWADSFTNAESPVVQGDGVVDTSNQSGDVWFLAGYFGDWYSDQGAVAFTRSISVPQGKALFFPVLNGELTPAEYNSYYGSGGDNVDNLWAELESWFPEPTPYAMSATIDGKKVKDVDLYRAPSPAAYQTWLPHRDNHMPAYYPHGGKVYPVVCDGYCLLVEPLPVGKHTIRFVASLGPQLTLDITYEIKVVDTD